MKYIWKIHDQYMHFYAIKFSEYFHSSLNSPVADTPFILYHKSIISTSRS